MQVTRLDSIEQCEAIAAAWDCMAHSVPFRRTAWLHSWWRHLRPGGELYVLQVSDAAGQVVGIAPWFMEYSLRHGRTVRPLGCGAVCSEYLGILSTSEHQQQVNAALTQWLFEAAAGEHGADNRWDLLDLVSIDAHDTLMSSWLRQMQVTGNHIHQRNAMSCWRANLPGTWDEYLSKLSRTYRKRSRRFVRTILDSGVARLRTASTPEELDEGMAILITLHQRRQESVGRPGCFSSQAFTDFLWDASPRMLADQTLRLYWLEWEGTPIAADYQMCCGDATYAYLGGINPDREDCSPGQIIQVAIMKQVIEEGQCFFDFLRGDEDYKSHWGVEERLCRDYRVVAARHSALLRHQVWLAGDTMKHWIKAGLHLTGVV